MASRKVPELSLADRKARLAADLLGDAEKLRLQLFHPTVRKEVKVTGLGEGVTEAEVVEVELDEPTFADKKLIVGSIAGIVDQLATLEAGAPAEKGGESEFERAKREREERRAAAKDGAASGRGGQ